MDEKSKLYSHQQFQQPVFQAVPPKHPFYHDGYASSPYYYPNQTPNPIIDNGGYYGPLDSKETHWKFGFCRIFMVLSIFVIVSLCFVSLVFWLLFWVELPEFQVNSISVPTFNATSSNLVAEWDVQLQILNPNGDFQLDFDHMMTSIVIKDTILAEAPSEDIHLNPQQKANIHNVLSRKESGTPLSQEIASQIEEERRDRASVTVGLNVIVNTNIKSRSSAKSLTMQVFCRRLTVGFPNEGVGYLTNPEAGANCLIYTS